MLLISSEVLLKTLIHALTYLYYDLRCYMHQVELEVEIKPPEKSLRIKSEMPSLFTITWKFMPKVLYHHSSIIIIIKV